MAQASVPTERVGSRAGRQNGNPIVGRDNAPVFIGNRSLCSSMKPTAAIQLVAI